MEKVNEEMTEVKNISTVSLGKYDIETCYYSPYPEEYYDDKMFICEYCLKYMKKKKTLLNHSYMCGCICPPGSKIYEQGGLSLFEVDGKDHKNYCQNLCLLSKLYLEHKSLDYSIDPFLFYVVNSLIIHR